MHFGQVAGVEVSFQKIGASEENLCVVYFLSQSWRLWRHVNRIQIYRMKLTEATHKLKHLGIVCMQILRRDKISRLPQIAHYSVAAKAYWRFTLHIVKLSCCSLPPLSACFILFFSLWYSSAALWGPRPGRVLSDLAAQRHNPRPLLAFLPVIAAACMLKLRPAKLAKCARRVDTKETRRARGRT